MSDDLSRRGFLRGLGAAVAASAAPEGVIEAATQAAEQTFHPLATERATDVWQLLEPYYARYGPNDFQDLRAETIQHLTGLVEELAKDPEFFRDDIHAYGDAARLLESGWTPPARLLPNTWTRATEDHGVGPEEPPQASAIQQEADRAPPEGQTPPGTPHKTIPVAEVEEAQTAGNRPEAGIRQRDEADTLASSAVTGHADEYPDLAANPDPVGVATQFPDGGISVHLGNGEWADIDRTPGAFTAVRLWPGHNSRTEDYRLYDHTGKQVAHADVAIVGDHAHVANIEAEGGANTLGVKALRILQAKLKEEFPELTAVKGLRSSGAEPGRTQEVKFQHPIPNEGKRAVTTAEHVDELRAELRGSLDSRKRDMIAAEIEAARKALKEQEHRRDQLVPAEGVSRPDVTPTRPDIDTIVAKLSAETGLPYTPAVGGEYVTGIYRQSLALTSGRYAMIDNGLGFALAPWTQELDRHLGRHVAGVAQESGGIEWSFGRKRGLGI